MGSVGDITEAATSACLFARGRVLGRLPFERVGGKQGGELAQGDRLLGGINHGFKLGSQTHQAIRTFVILPEPALSRPCPTVPAGIFRSKEKGHSWLSECPTDG